MLGSWLFGLLLGPFHRARRARTARAQEPYPDPRRQDRAAGAAGIDDRHSGAAVANQLSEKWGKPVIVENMPGAAMNIGSEYVAHAAPDGYTLLLCPPSPLAIQQLLYHNLKYDPTKFVPDRAAGQDRQRARRAAEISGQGRAGPDRLRQGQSRQAHLSRRKASARPRSCRAAELEVLARHQDGARALSRRAAGAHRPDGRQRRHVLRHARDLDRRCTTPAK